MWLLEQLPAPISHILVPNTSPEHWYHLPEWSQRCVAVHACSCACCCGAHPSCHDGMPTPPKAAVQHCSDAASLPSCMHGDQPPLHHGDQHPCMHAHCAACQQPAHPTHSLMLAMLGSARQHHGMQGTRRLPRCVHGWMSTGQQPGQLDRRRYPTVTFWVPPGLLEGAGTASMLGGRERMKAFAAGHTRGVIREMPLFGPLPGLEGQVEVAVFKESWGFFAEATFWVSPAPGWGPAAGM